jgi:hypothetical protein
VYREKALAASDRTRAIKLVLDHQRAISYMMDRPPVCAERQDQRSTVRLGLVPRHRRPRPGEETDPHQEACRYDA